MIFFYFFFSVFQDLPISQDHYLKNVANHRSFARQMELRDYFRSPKRGELFHDIGFTKFFDFHKNTNFVCFWIHIYKLQVLQKKPNIYCTFWANWAMYHRKCLQLYFYFLFSYFHESQKVINFGSKVWFLNTEKSWRFFFILTK